MCKDFRFYYFWWYFVFQNFQNGYFRISLCTILFEDIKRNMSHSLYNIGSQIKVKTTMLKSGLCDYSDVYILVNVTVTITGEEADAAARQR